VVLDASGPIGYKVLKVFRAHLEDHPHAFELISVRSSDKATDASVRCHLVRDQLWYRFAEWMRDDGAIPPDDQLQRELNVPSWYTPPGKDVLKVTSKDDMIGMLEGRSPDSADACCLSTWTSPMLDEDDLPGRGKNGSAAASEDVENLRPGELDPYEGQIDPYGWER
jgi:hypothetical protein